MTNKDANPKNSSWCDVSLTGNVGKQVLVELVYVPDLPSIEAITFVPLCNVLKKVPQLRNVPFSFEEIIINFLEVRQVIYISPCLFISLSRDFFS